MIQDDKTRQVDAAWKAICDIETPVREVTDFLQALILVAINLEEDLSGPIVTIASTARDLCESIEELRCECFSAIYACKFGPKSSDKEAHH